MELVEIPDKCGREPLNGFCFDYLKSKLVFIQEEFKTIQYLFLRRHILYSFESDGPRGRYRLW